MSFYKNEEDIKRERDNYNKKMDSMTMRDMLSLSSKIGLSIILVVCLVLAIPRKSSKDENKVVTGASVDIAETPSPTSTETPMVTATPKPTSTPQVNEGRKITYDKGYASIVKRAFKPYTYIKMQTVQEAVDISNMGNIMSNGAMSAGEYKFDTKNQRLHADITVYKAGAGITNKQKFSIRVDYKKKLFYTKNGKDKWKQYTKHGLKLKNYKKGDTVYDIYKSTLAGVIDNVTEGESKDGIDTFIFRRKATDSDLMGEDFSDYKPFNVEVAVKYASNTHLPISVMKSVTFGKTEETDVLTDMVFFDDLSNEKLEVKKIKTSKAKK